jgi:hypothetical protein
VTTSGEDGAYAFEGLPRTRPWQPDPAHEANGLVFAWIEAPGYASSEGIVPLRVPAEAASLTQDFTLHPGVTIRGHATDAKPMDGVAWIPGEFGPYAEMLVVQGTLTGRNGAFVLVDVPPGKVTLRVAEGRQVVLEGLRPGETREGVVIPAAK